MTNVIDRRGQAGSGSVSRQRALERSTRHIKKAIDKAITDGNITDLGTGGIDVVVPKEDLHQPRIHHGRGGIREVIHPGNKEFHAGQEIARPPGGGGGNGSGKAGNSGEGQDEYSFRLSEEEFFNYLFKDLELPNLEQKKESDITRTKLQYAGIVSDGPQNKLDLARSKRKKMGRVIAAEKPHNDKILSLLQEEKQILKAYDETMTKSFNVANSNLPKVWVSRKDQIKKLDREVGKLKSAFGHALTMTDAMRIQEIDYEIATAQKRKKSIPGWNESTDLKYRHHAPKPTPNSKAVMFCLMDVSGSMTQEHKDQAKLFYVLLYRFLKKNYKKIDVVFIRHHTTAEETNEEDFFYKRDTGGTIVSTALEFMLNIKKERYSDGNWNVYCAQASDGDNWRDDSEKCIPVMREILSDIQGYFYTEITPRETQELWSTYEGLSKEFSDRFWMQQIKKRQDIWPVFRELFKKRGGSQAQPSSLTM